MVETKRLSNRTLLVISSIGIILTLLIIIGVTNYTSTHYYLSEEKGSQVTFGIRMDGVVHLQILDTEYLFCYYYSAGTLEKSPLKVSITKSWGPMVYGDGGFYAIAGSINYDSDGLLKIQVLDSNANYVKLLVQRV